MPASRPKNLLVVILVGLSAWWSMAGLAVEDKTTTQVDSTPSRAETTSGSAAIAARPAIPLERLRGQVVWLSDVLRRRHQLEIVPEAHQYVLALEADDGRVYPLVEDTRGRAFRVDARLRDMKVELLVRSFPDTSCVQVVRVYEIEGDRKYVIDYWCDVCSIAMYEAGPCACCQAENRLRKRPASD
jgi:hypothetical protein